MVKIFVSSEMKSDEDNERRQAAIQEIHRLGHTPKYFEGIPSRYFGDDRNAIDKCIELVRDSEAMILIVDDTVTKIMQLEVQEGVETFGKDNVYLYFTKDRMRDNAATDLWNSAKQKYSLKQFVDTNDLRDGICKSIASYLEDEVRKKDKSHDLLFDKKIQIGTNGKFELALEDLKKGDILTITCLGDKNFYAGLFNRGEFIGMRTSGIGGSSDFPFGSDSLEYTERVTIPDDDDYYLVLRVGVFTGYIGNANIHVKIKKRI